MADPAEMRRCAVHEWQRFYNMEPRTDSRLTERYARGEFEADPAAVARELMATDFVYRTTLYGEIIEEYMRAVADRLRDAYGLSWTATWQVVQFYAPIALKLLMLLHTGQSIPPALPLTCHPSATPSPPLSTSSPPG